MECMHVGLFYSRLKHKIQNYADVGFKKLKKGGFVGQLLTSSDWDKGHFSPQNQTCELSEDSPCWPLKIMQV